MIPKCYLIGLHKNTNTICDTSNLILVFEVSWLNCTQRLVIITSFQITIMIVSSKASAVSSEGEEK